MSYNTTAPQVLIKQPYDEAIYSMEFAALLDASETITEASAIPDPNDGSLVLSNITVSGTLILMKITGGVHNTNYRVEVRITTSSGNKFEGDGILKVRDN